MSSYIHFFAERNGNFVEILCYSRSNTIYDIFDWAPYEKIKKLSVSDVQDAISDLNDRIDRFNKSIGHYESLIKDVSMCAAPLSEKIESIEEYRDTITDYQSTLEDYKFFKPQLYLLRDMVEIAEENEKWSEDKGTYGIYIGIECGSNVTMEDIVG